LAYVKMLGMRECEDLPLGYLFQRAMALLRPQVTAELRPLGLGLPQFVCMRILSVSLGRSSAELARDTNVTPQAMDQLLSGLQDAGVVTRPEVVSSGRARPAKLTARGRALLKRAEAAVRAADERILIDLTPIERRQLKSLLYALGPRTADRALEC
jgi:DNA-binding MarR family transcriptional regulator